MSLIDRLIAKLCPKGVEFKRLGEIAGIASTRADAAKLDAASYVGVDNLLPNFGGRKDSDYEANSSGAISFKSGDVLIGNIRPYLKKVWLADRDGGASPDVLTISLLPTLRKTIVPRFLYFLIASDSFIRYSTKHAKGAKMPRGDKAAILNFRVPVPPLEIQREIVKVLDTFTKLEAELEAELEARRKQYKHYLDSLLTFDDASNKEERVRWAALKEVGEFTRGRRFTNKDFVESGIPCIHYGEVYTHYGLSATETKSFVRPELAPSLRMAKTGDLIIAGTGENVEDIGKAVAWLGKGEVAVHDDCYIFRHSMNPKYAAYFFQSGRFNQQKVKHAAGAKMIRISSEGLQKIQVPVPSLAEQSRIVAILDKFDALTKDLSEGLPAEISARRKQYEHYRDSLLTFAEIPA